MSRACRVPYLITALGAIVLGLTLITGVGIERARAAACTASPVTDPMNVSVSPDANVRAFARLDVSFSGAISDGHCAGDAFSFAIPPTLTAQDGATYPLKAPDGSVVANLTISGGRATVTLTDYVESHQGVTLGGFFNAQIDDSTSPGGTDDVTWDINGHSTPTPIGMADCPGCSDMPRRPSKSGVVSGGGLRISISTPTSTTDNQVFTFTDTLTSPGQEFGCPVTSTAGLYRSRTEWGVPIVFRRNAPVTITACSATAVSGSITLASTGTAARIRLPVMITDPSATSWTDSATVVSNGRTWTTSTRVERFGGGGSGSGTTPVPSSSSPTPTPISSSPSSSPPSSASTSAGSSSVSSSVSSSGSSSLSVSAGSSSRSSGSLGVLPTAINGGGGPGTTSAGARVAGVALLLAGLLGLGAFRFRAGRGRPRGRHV